MRYDNILIEVRGEAPLSVGVITLNRPKQFNALNDGLMDDLGAALKAYDADDGIGCFVVAGSEKAFAAGADIAAMAQFDHLHVYKTGYITRNWDADNGPQAGDGLCAWRGWSCTGSQESRGWASWQFRSAPPRMSSDWLDEVARTWVPDDFVGSWSAPLRLTARSLDDLLQGDGDGQVRFAGQLD
jgi:hypothetical protein